MMTKAQQLAMVVSNIIPRIQGEMEMLKTKGNESAMIDRADKDLDLILVICGGVKDDSFD